jgi:Flp pilus assembly protein TadG
MLRRLVRSQKGQGIVELALLLPVVTLLLLGIMEGGRIFSSYIELENVAREGARYAAVNCTSISVRDDQVQGWVSSTLTPWLETRLSTLQVSSLVVSFTRTVSADLTEVWVELSVTYPLEITTPIISTMTGNPFNLQSKMVMKGE